MNSYNWGDSLSARLALHSEKNADFRQKNFLAPPQKYINHLENTNPNNLATVQD